MLDLEKIGREFTKILNSYSADDLQAVIDEYNQQIALADLNKTMSKAAAPQRRVTKPKPNGASINGKMPYKVTVRPKRKIADTVTA